MSMGFGMSINIVGEYESGNVVVERVYGSLEKSTAIL